MGACCGCAKDDNFLVTSYQQAWQVYHRILINNSYRGPPNKQKIFQHLYYSVAVPIQERAVLQIQELIQLISQNRYKNRLEEPLRQKRQILLASLNRLEQDRKAVYDQIIKIRSSIMQSNPQPSAPYNLKRGGNESTHSEIIQSKKSKLQRISSQIAAQSVHLEGSQLQYSLPPQIMSNIAVQNKLGLEDTNIDLQNMAKDKLIQNYQFEKDKRILAQQRVMRLQEGNQALTEECIRKNDLYKQYQDRYKDEILINKKLSMQKLQIQTKYKICMEDLTKIEKELQQLRVINKIIEQKSAHLSGISNKSTLLTLNQSLKLTIQPQKLCKIEKLASMRSFIIVENDQQLNEVNKQRASYQQDYRILFSLFSHSKILPNYQQFQSAVGTRTIISEMFAEAVTKTELLYAFDEINPLHYNKYINDRENLLIIIKLKNQIILGAFAGKVEDNEHTQSFIFSISSKRQPTKLMPSKRIKKIDIDSSNLVFGIGELRIKAKTLELSCNIGCFQSIFTQNNRAARIESFLQTSQRSHTMESYEIHQIYFQNDQ